jgi:hypothetical protein
MMNSRPAGEDGRRGLVSNAMKVDFTPEQEAQLSRIAAHAGIDPEHFVKDIACARSKRTPSFALRCVKVSGRPTVAN